VNTLIAKESSAPPEQEGISYTEFSYILLQAFDYLTLYQKYHCTADGRKRPVGNITAGVDLIRRVHGVQAHALVWPLLTSSTGVKFGKSEVTVSGGCQTHFTLPLLSILA
jgi:tyrosyl-tRNA synthetase